MICPGPVSPLSPCTFFASPKSVTRGLPALIDQDICRLDVAMDHAPSMGILRSPRPPSPSASPPRAAKSAPWPGAARGSAHPRTPSRSNDALRAHRLRRSARFLDGRGCAAASASIWNRRTSVSSASCPARIILSATVRFRLAAGPRRRRPFRRAPARATIS